MKINLLKNKEKLKINTIKSNTNDNERTREKSTGRSMVEMLGVLAIIGVLSIGGIQGYTIAMRKYRANEIIAVANKYALFVYAQIQSIRLEDPDRANEYAYYNYNHSDSADTTDYSGTTYMYIDPKAVWGSSGLVSAFTDTGLGGYPQGVKFIRATSVLMDRKNSQSGDVVSISIFFDDENLCKTVFGIVNDDHSHDLGMTVINCKKESDGFLYRVPFYMN